jgi:hypothetical protein
MADNWQRELARVWRKSRVSEEEFLAAARTVCKQSDAKALIFGAKWVGRFTRSSPLASVHDVLNFYNAVVWRQRKVLHEIVADGNASCVEKRSGEYAMLASCLEFTLGKRMDSFLSRLRGNWPTWFGLHGCTNSILTAPCEVTKPVF